GPIAIRSSAASARTDCKDSANHSLSRFMPPRREDYVVGTRHTSRNALLDTAPARRPRPQNKLRRIAPCATGSVPAATHAQRNASNSFDASYHVDPLGRYRFSPANPCWPDAGRVCQSGFSRLSLRTWARTITNPDRPAVSEAQAVDAPPRSLNFRSGVSLERHARGLRVPLISPV